MPLTDPQIDPRTYKDILSEATARIRVHNPEWTNHNNSDPGITLLQLFAFMSESITYRTNLIPRRNREKYLRLLGIGMRAPASAEGFVGLAFSGPVAVAQTLPPDLPLSAGEIPFRTATGLEVLPVEARVYYKRPLDAAETAAVDDLYSQLYASQLEEGDTAAYYETRIFEPPVPGAAGAGIELGQDTVDASLWIGLFAPRGRDPATIREAIGGRTLSLGVAPVLGEDGKVLFPRGTGEVETQPSLIFETPAVTTALEASYARLTPRSDNDPLARPRIVELPLPPAAELGYWDDLDPLEAGVGDFPPSLEDRQEAPQLVTWLRLRSPEADSAIDGTEGAADPVYSRQVRAQIAWVGVNAARVVQRAEVLSERLPRGTGEPDQAARLANTPVLTGTVRISVDGTPWSRIDDLFAAGPEVPPQAPRFDGTPEDPADANVFTVDRESGEIRFGDGIHGRRPARGAAIQASYSFGGGIAGNVGIAEIKKGAPAGLSVSNPLPTWAGSEGETLEEAERRIPKFLAHRERLVTSDDFSEITRATPGVDIGRVEVLPLFHPDLPGQASDGVVTLMVIPASDPVEPNAPTPDRLFLEAICRHVEPRRLITTELHVRGPDYVPVWVSVAIDVVPGQPEATVRDAVRAALLTFLSPLTGGFDGAGWPIDRADTAPRGQPVEVAELLVTAARVPGVASLRTLRLGDQAGEVVDRLDLSGLQLPKVKAIAVTSGEAPSIEALQGRTPARPGGGVRTRPLPVIPEEC